MPQTTKSLQNNHFQKSQILQTNPSNFPLLMASVTSLAAASASCSAAWAARFAAAAKVLASNGTRCVENHPHDFKETHIEYMKLR